MIQNGVTVMLQTERPWKLSKPPGNVERGTWNFDQRLQATLRFEKDRCRLEAEAEVMGGRKSCKTLMNIELICKHDLSADERKH